MKSSFFYGARSAEAAAKIQAASNTEPTFLSAITAHSPRAVGDATQSLVEKKFESIIGDWCAEYSSSFARRAMADLGLRISQDFYCIVDVKTHRLDTTFNMPALVSVKRLARFYEDDMNVFSILMIKYEIIDNRMQVNEVIFLPIEFLDWSCLTVGALGWGQIQIANSNNIVIRHGQSRKTWMLSLCDVLQEFYPKEILKITERVNEFNKVKSYWHNKPDLWT